MVVSGEKAHASDYIAGLDILDVSAPAAPQLLTTCDTPGEAWDVELAGGLGSETATAAWGVVARAHADLGRPAVGAARVRLEVRPEGRDPGPEEVR